MKKLLSFFLCLMLSIFSVGCTFNTTVNIVIDIDQPWTIGSNFEECVYSVVKKDANGVVLGTGTLSTTASINTESKTTTIDCAFSFSQAGSTTSATVTDTIVSSATILNSSCATIKSSKTVNLASDPDLSYSFSADYESRKVDYYTNGATSPTKTLEIPSSEKTVLDNEALYYVVRAFNPTEQTEGNFLLTNLYDCYTNDRIASYSVYYRASEVLLSVDDFRIANSESASVFAQNGQIKDNKIECYHAKINRNETNMSGAPVEMWFSKNPFVGGKKRVMVKMITTTRTIPDANVDYTIEYELVSYRFN